MTSFIGSPPPQYLIPLTYGADFTFTLVRQDGSGNAVDWGGQLLMTIHVTHSNPLPVYANVSGSQAVFVIPAAICNQVVSPDTTSWQIIFQDEITTPPTNIAIAVGVFSRCDGIV